MKKYIISIILLLLLDISFAYYLKQLINSKRNLVFIYDDVPLFIQKNEIELDDIDDFLFDNYFINLSFKNKTYNCQLDENICYIKDSKNREYNFDFIINQPIIITRTETIYVEKYIDNNYNILENNILSNEIYCYNDYLCFECGTSISQIISEVSNCVESNSYITCDYSNLNPNISGVYTIRFFNSDDQVFITVEII